MGDVPEAPLFTFGVCTDLQWAEIPDGAAHAGQKRYYRNSYELFKLAAADFEAASVDFAFHLGDIVDAQAQKQAGAGVDPQAQADRALDLALEACGIYKGRFYHIVGNHCLYNFSRPKLSAAYQIKSTDDRLYYSFSPHSDWKILVLDSFDVSIQGWPEGTPEHASALKLLQSHRSPTEESMYSFKQNQGVERRWVGFGGGVGQQQLEWAASELASAKAEGKRALVFSHCTFHPDAVNRPATLMWNYTDVLDVLWKAGNVAATFAGHAHKQGHCQDEMGIYHHVLPALLETPPGNPCHGFVSVYQDRIHLRGMCAMSSVDMPNIGASAKSDAY